MCLWFPGWPIQRLRRTRPELDRLPLVLYPSPQPLSREGRWTKLWVTARSRTAGRHGVAVGMPLAEARALTSRSGTRFEMHNPCADRETLRKIAVWCQRFTPVVAVEEREPAESLLLDITGCGPLFGGEEALARKVVSEFRRRRFWVTAAVADTIGTAWAVAHFLPSPGGRGAGGEGESIHKTIAKHSRGEKDPHPQPLSRRERGETIVPPGKHAEALRPLPVEALRLPASTVELLREFDIRCVGELLALPRAELPGRFGPELVRRLDQALGHVPELLTPERADEPIEASWTFEPPATERRAIDAVFDHLLEQTLARLPRHMGVQRLSCMLRTAATPVSVGVNLLRPSASARHLGELARLHFEHVRLPAEVSAMTVRADAVAPLEFRQGQIFEDDAGDERRRKFQVLIERLSSRLGEMCVLRPRLWPDVQPELAWRGEPWLSRSSPNGATVNSQGRKPLEKNVARIKSQRDDSIDTVYTDGQHSKCDGTFAPSGLEEHAAVLQGLTPLAIDGRPVGAANAQLWHGLATVPHSSTEGLHKQLRKRKKTETLPCHSEDRSPIRALRAIRGCRPTCLKPQPIAIAVTSLFPGGPPMRFEWQGQTRTVARYRGPERIETGWWRGPDIRRDYYLVDTDDGARWWLFRTLREESWFMQGAF